MTVVSFGWRKECKKDFQFPHSEELFAASNKLRNQWKLDRAPRVSSHDVTGRWAAIAALAHENQISINTVIHEKGTDRTRTCWNILIQWTSSRVYFNRMFRNLGFVGLCFFTHSNDSTN
jgi:hypothetical protein